MNRLSLSGAVACLAASLTAVAQQDAERSMATGIVFHDANGNGVFDEGEEPLPQIRMSNGREIVKTDDFGRYRLPVDQDTILFVIKPRGWRTPLSETHLPRFYYNHKPHGSPQLRYGGVPATGPLPKSIDFPLYPQEEPNKFQAILFGDPQPRDQKEVDYIAHDVIESLMGTQAAFGVTLGDIVFDDLSLFESEAKTIALLGIPWYNVIGNHDINFDAKDDRHSDETFERMFGPAYYSFDYGPTHFVVIDNVEWRINETNGKGSYRGGIGDAQLEFIRRDLEGTPKDQLVVLLMHIPLVAVHDRHNLYRLIENRPFCISISGHTHTHEHRFITREDGWQGPEPHHHIINVTVCGSWWRGMPDERGIPHATMQDGAPNGHSVITFDGTDYTLDFRAAGRPDDYQMEVYSPEVVSCGSTDQTEVLANIFNGSPRSEVRMKVDDGTEWIVMKRVAVEDPAYRKAYELDQQHADRTWLDASKPKRSSHIWAANLPAGLEPGVHVIHVHTVDMFGRAYRGRRIFRVSQDDS
jgi:hypothetical protein